MKVFITIAIFIGVHLGAAWLAWLGGYNFDTRNGYVAYWAAITAAIGGLLASWYWSDK